MLVALAGALLGGLAGCAGASRERGGADDTGVTRGLERSEAYVDRTTRPVERPAGPNRPLALLDGDPITLADLGPGLIEAAGATVLQEHVLDTLLRRELARTNRTVGQDQIDAELNILLGSLTSAGVATGSDEARELLAPLRAGRALGDTRFRALLWRNAAMRGIVAPRIEVTGADLELAYELRYGPSYSARLITTDSAAQASEALRRIRAGEPFGEVAAELSTDSSRDRGGLLPPISPADPTFPASVRTTLAGMSPGEVSQPIALDASYAILELERITPAPADAPPSAEAARDELERDVRLQKERRAMDELARELLESARVQVLDPQLQREWVRRLGG